MLEIRGNLFNEQGCDAICVTTNGFVKKDGKCVMGRGCAKTLSNLATKTPLILGNAIKRYGNRVNLITKKTDGTLVYSFPVKPAQAIVNSDKTNVVSHLKHICKIGQLAPGWMAKADIDIILKSANELLELANKNNWKKVVIPRPGCGAGELEWPPVKLLLQSILDDRFYAITF